jgi:hypothetical protein
MGYLVDIIRDARRKPQKFTEQGKNAPAVQRVSGDVAVSSNVPDIQKTKAATTKPAKPGAMIQTPPVKDSSTVAAVQSPKAVITESASRERGKVKIASARQGGEKSPRKQPELGSAAVGEGLTKPVESTSRRVRRKVKSVTGQKTGKQPQSEKTSAPQKRPADEKTSETAQTSGNRKRSATKIRSAKDSAESTVPATETVSRRESVEMRLSADQMSRKSRLGEPQHAVDTNTISYLSLVAAESRKNLANLKPSVDESGVGVKVHPGKKTITEITPVAEAFDDSGKQSEEINTVPSINSMASKDRGIAEFANKDVSDESQDQAKSEDGGKQDPDASSYQTGISKPDEESISPVFESPPSQTSPFDAETGPEAGGIPPYVQSPQNEPQVQIGLIEIVVSSPAGNSARPVQRTVNSGNFASRLYLRRV